MTGSDKGSRSNRSGKSANSTISARSKQSAARKAVFLALTAAISFAPALHAQDCNLAGAPVVGLRTPLVNGSSFGHPFAPAPKGAPPATGHGAVPAPVVPGHCGPPTLIPSVLHTPSDHLGTPNYHLPHSPASVHRPGEAGPSYWVPPPPSTPGCDPGQFGGPRDFYPPPITETHINPGGGISASAPTQRWGGQTTRDFGRYKYRGTRSFDFGQGLCGQTSQDGPNQHLPGAMPTQDLFGMRGFSKNGPTTMTYAPY